MRLLLVQTGFLGDVILSTPVATNLERLFPTAEIVALTTPGAEDLLRGHPSLSRVMVFDKRKTQSGVGGLLRMARILRAEKFDAAFSLHKSYRTAILLKMAGIPIRYGFSEAAASWLYTAKASRKDLNHEVLRNLALLRCVGLEPADADQELALSVSDTDAVEARRLLAAEEGTNFVGIAPGSVWLTKRWTIDGYVETVKGLVGAGYAVVLIGGSDDAEIAAEIEAKSGVAVRNFVGKTSLKVSAALVAAMKVLVTNDSAPLHVASAVGTPVVALFCATIPEFGYGPWRVQHRSLGVTGLSCRPCGRHGGQQCPTGTHACRVNLPASQVIEAALNLANFELPKSG